MSVTTWSLHGLHIGPDLDTITYTLAGMDNRETGWAWPGRPGPSWTSWPGSAGRAGSAGRPGPGHPSVPHRTLAGGEPSERGDRGARGAAGDRGAAVPGDRRRPPHPGNPRRGHAGTAGTEVAFQDYFVRLHHAVAVQECASKGPTRAEPGPGVLEALGRGETSSCVRQTRSSGSGPILAVPEVRRGGHQRRDHDVAVSPIVAGAALKGPADR